MIFGFLPKKAYIIQEMRENIFSLSTLEEKRLRRPYDFILTQRITDLEIDIGKYVFIAEEFLTSTQLMTFLQVVGLDIEVAQRCKEAVFNTSNHTAGEEY